jgi:predicted RND superfamily exporter protein
MKSNLVDFFLRLYDRMAAHRLLVLGTTMVLVVASTSALIGVELDMSFNPFFSNDPVENRITRELQGEFGNRLGSYIGAIVERKDALRADFLPAIEALSADVERLDHVSEVISLARFPVPYWHPGGAEPVELFGEVRGEGAEALWEERSVQEAVRGIILSEDGRKTLLLA